MLFSWKSKKTERAQCLLEQYDKSTRNHRDTCCFYFETLFAALSYDPNRGHLRYIGNEAYNLIRGKDAYFVANLMHRCYTDPTPADLNEWKRQCTPDGYRALLICGSAHPNGFFRERCLRRLGDQRDVLQFFLLRTNDWVPEIRRLAIDMLPALLRSASVSEIVDAMPFVEHVRRGQRARRDAYFSMDMLDAILLERFAQEPQTVLFKPITRRRFCYKVLLLRPDPQYRDLMLHFIRNDRDGAQRSSLVRCFLQTAAAPVPQELLDTFQKDKYWRVRLDAYEYRMKTEGAWVGLEQLLLSPSYPIREFAEYYLEQKGFDSLGYCREHLPESLLALCDLGTRDDIPRIRPYLETHPRSTLITLVRLGAEDSETLIWKYMHHENAKLAKAAYRLAAAQPRFAPAQLLPEIKKTTDPQLQWRLIRLLGKTGDWEVLPILIRLIKDYSHNRPSIIELIQQRSKFRTSISRELADEITEALHYAGSSVPFWLNNQIFFDMRVLSSPQHENSD